MFAYLRMQNHEPLQFRSIALRPLNSLEITGDYTVMYVSLPKESADNTQLLDILMAQKRISVAFTIFEGRSYLYTNAGSNMTTINTVVGHCKTMDLAFSSVPKSNTSFSDNDVCWLYFRTDADAPQNPPYSGQSNIAAFWSGIIENYTIAVDAQSNPRSARITLRMIAGKATFK